VRSSSNVPTLTSAQVREVDRLTWARFGIPVSWLMEAAGWQVARHCRARAYVVCGKGNNGGDGLAAARHLHRWGRLAGIACLDLAALSGPAAEEAHALQRLGITVDPEPDPGDAQLIVDAVLGTGLSRPPEGKAASWIEAINSWRRRVVSVDLPSGLNGDTGAAPGVCVRADMTVTLGLPKPGLLEAGGPEHAGEVWVADIGIPFEAYAAVGIEVPPHLFTTHDRIQLSSVRL
jgi:ADP-dependent NAD(P)H-hydrate dehydratase / NAD(P)H-hydrate epimerase